MKATHVYVSFHCCGGWNAVCTDLPEYVKENKNDIGSWIMRGDTVNRMTIEEFNALTNMCGCGEDKQGTLL
jgi:hypothetical protein